MDTTINYAVRAFTAVVKLQLFPEALRPLVARLGFVVPELAALRRDMASAADMLRPVIGERLRSAGAGSERPQDFLDWLLDSRPRLGETGVGRKSGRRRG